MGLFTGLLTLPLAPVRGVGWLAQQLQDQAAEEYYDENRIMLELAALEQAHADGEIGDARLSEGTDSLLERLQEGRRYREWRGIDG